MTLEIVKSRLDRLIADPTPRVAMLTGDWGAGKTYQWKKALERAREKRNTPRYAYVSLFGLTSLAEVRKRISEEIISSINLPENNGTVGDAVANGSLGLKPMQILKILPVIPYLGKLESLAQELSFATVKRAVICFDDLERAPASLRIADVFGLASFLREERECRVLIISNQKKLGDDAKSDFSLYLEKVVEETVNFSPTPEEACMIALGGSRSEARNILADKVTILGVSNIRVISRLGILADELAQITAGLHSLVIYEMMKTLALFGVAHFIPNREFPSVDYLLGSTHYGWSGFFKQENYSDELKTEQEKKESKWKGFLSEYGHLETSLLDKEIYAGVNSGFFCDEKIRSLSEDLSQRIKDGDCRAIFNRELSKFLWGIDDSTAAYEKMLSATLAALGVIGSPEFYTVYKFQQQVEGESAAKISLNQFVAKNSGRREAFILSFHSSGNYDDYFRSVIEVEALRLKEPVDLANTLDKINFNRGWDPEDLATIAAANFDDVVYLLTHAESHGVFISRITTLLKFGQKSQTPEQQKVYENMISWLKKIAANDPISALRVQRFLPS